MANRSKSTLFLIEQLMVIVVFAICAVACISIMTAAYFNAHDSRDLSNAVLVAESGAEVFKATGGNRTATVELIGGAAGPLITHSADLPAYVLVCYNEDWQICDNEDAVYFLRISVTQSEKQNDSDLWSISADLSVTKRATGDVLVSFPILTRTTEPDTEVIGFE